MTQLPKIDILIPMYNAGKYIKKCVESLVNQTYENIRIVIVDDGSIDNGADIIRDIISQDDRVVLFSKPNEKNVAITRNFLLSKVEADLFMFVDSDDYVEPSYVYDLYGNMMKYDSDMSICDFRFEFHKPKMFSKKTKFEREYDMTDGIGEMILGRDIHFMLWNKLYKTKLAKGITFAPEIRYGEDLLFVYKYSKNCQKISFIKKPLYHYIMHKNSEMHCKFGEKQLTLLKGLKDMIDAEKDNNLRQILEGWYAFSLVGDLHYARKGRYALEDQRKQKFVDDAKLYKSSLMNCKYTRDIYKTIYNILSAKYLR